MNILGMGSVEVLVILLVAFIVMGPERMVDAGRLLGKALRETRRLSEGLPGMILDEEQARSEVARERRSGGAPDATASDATDEETVSVDHDEAPVAFEPSEKAAAANDTDGPQESQKL